MKLLWTVSVCIAGLWLLEKVLYLVSNKVLYVMTTKHGDDYWEYLQMQISMYFEDNDDYLNYAGDNVVLRKMTSYERSLDTSMLIIAETIEYIIIMNKNKKR